MSDAALASGLKSGWATYRQALRDITEANASPEFIEWPTPPALA